MRSTAHIDGHPIHPMLIPFPFALLSTAAAFDIAATMRAEQSWSQTARHMTIAGLGTALVAAIPGVLDYFGTVPPRTSAHRSATQHALCNLSALACFAVGESRRRNDGRLDTAGLTLRMVGTGLLSLAGWLGGRLVYHEHIGVDDKSDSHALIESRARLLESRAL